MIDVAIVIVSHNTRTDLRNCLQSLHQYPPRAAHRIVVVDNASQDGSAAAVRKEWPGVHLIALDTNVGFAAGNNAGIRATASEMILLLNSDTIVPDGAIDRLVSSLRALPQAAIVGPRIVDGSGHPELSFGRMMSPLAEARQKFLTRYASLSRINALTAHTREVDWVSGACLLVRRRDAEAAGLLDERYFMYCEDVDFCAAVRTNGGRVYFVADASIVHLRGRSWRSRPGGNADTYHRSQLAFYRKHHPMWEPILRLYLALQGNLPINKG